MVTTATGRPATHDFRLLPVNADEGFPQAFLLVVGSATYRFTLHVNVPEETLPDPEEGREAVLDLAPSNAGRGFMVIAVVREDPGGEATLLRRKIVPGLEYQVGELVLTFHTLRVALRNLNGIGAFGSEVVGGVALR
jgi:hypothetical protein